MVAGHEKLLRAPQSPPSGVLSNHCASAPTSFELASLMMRCWRSVVVSGAVGRHASHRRWWLHAHVMPQHGALGGGDGGNDDDDDDDDCGAFPVMSTSCDPDAAAAAAAAAASGDEGALLAELTSRIDVDDAVDVDVEDDWPVFEAMPWSQLCAHRDFRSYVLLYA